MDTAYQSASAPTMAQAPTLHSNLTETSAFLDDAHSLADMVLARIKGGGMNPQCADKPVLPIFEQSIHNSNSANLLNDKLRAIRDLLGG